MHDLDEIVKLCRTCGKAKPLAVTSDYLCKKFGPVSHDYVCKAYVLNEFLPRPRPKRMIDTSKFDTQEFNIVGNGS